MRDDGCPAPHRVVGRMVVGHETGLACDERIAARITNAEKLTAATSQSVRSHVHARNLITAVVLVAVADWLFYGHPLGVSAAVFVVSLGVGTAMSYPVRARGADWTIATTILAFSVAPLITQPGILAMAFGALGVAYFATTLHDADSPLPFRFDGAEPVSGTSAGVWYPISIAPAVIGGAEDRSY